ncbi:MAG TPA: transporter substrate-binding domain-containing protein [Stellaceae bacterium]|nr:transporter substrate-binding domain-containing protein [Stellaceae bacterium]
MRQITRARLAAVLLVLLAGPASAAGLPEIQGRGWMTVAVASDAPPFAAVASGKSQGFDIDLIDRLRRVASFEVRVQPMPADKLLAALRSGAADLAVGGIPITEDRQRAARFGPPLAEIGDWYMKRKDDTKIRGIADLGGRDFAVTDGPGGVLVQSELEHRIAKAGGALGNPVEFPTAAAAADALTRHKVDYVVGDLTALTQAIAAHPDRFELGERVAQTRYAGWAVAVGNDTLAAWLGDFLGKERQSGELAVLQRHWLGRSFPDLPDNVTAQDWWTARQDKPAVLPIPTNHVQD